jgi:hypothetical protein
LQEFNHPAKNIAGTFLNDKGLAAKNFGEHRPLCLPVSLCEGIDRETGKQGKSTGRRSRSIHRFVKAVL